MNHKNRDKDIIKASIISVVVNILLAISKMIVGIFSNSIAIILDAVNSFSDVLASVVTIISVKLSSKMPNRKHPYGYGRIEYISTTIISFLVIYAGIESLIESIKKLIHTEPATYSGITLFVVFLGVIAKIILSRYVIKVGEKTKSSSLIASGHEAGHDAILSASTLVAAIIFIFTGLSLEAMLGIVISAFIIQSGFDMLLETLTHIIGKRTDSLLSKQIKKSISENKFVHGAYDLELHNYGPNKLVGSVHIEIDDTLTANEIDELSRTIQKDIHEKHNVGLSTVGIYSVNTKDEFVLNLRGEILNIIMSHNHVVQMHGFYVDKKEKSINFDIVIDFTSEDAQKTYGEILKELNEKYPEYEFYIKIDAYITD